MFCGRLNIIYCKYFGKMEQKERRYRVMWKDICGRIYARSDIIDFTRPTKVIGKDLPPLRIRLTF